MSNKNQHPRDLGLDLQKTFGSSENTTVDFDTKETRQTERVRCIKLILTLENFNSEYLLIKI